MAKIKHAVNEIIQKENIDNHVSYLYKKCKEKKIVALLSWKTKTHLLCIIKGIKISSVYPIFKLRFVRSHY